MEDMSKVAEVLPGEDITEDEIKVCMYALYRCTAEWVPLGLLLW